MIAPTSDGRWLDDCTRLLDDHKVVTWAFVFMESAILGNLKTTLVFLAAKK